MQKINFLKRVSPLLAILFSLLIVSCGANNSAEGDAASSSSIVDAASKAANDMADKSKEMATKASNSISETTDQIAEGLGEAGDNVAKTAANMNDKMTKSADNMADKAMSAKDKMADKAMSAKDKMADKAMNTKDKMMDKANSSKDKMMNKATNAKEKMMDKAKAKATTRPTTSRPSATSQPSSKIIKTTPVQKVMDKKDDLMDKKDAMINKATSAGLSHTAFDQLLRKHVSSTGVVNYSGLQSEITKLDTYLAMLSANPVQSSWDRNKKLAYWINAYNAFTMKLILNNYPLAKITDLEGGKPWDKKFIKLGAKTYSLNNIENDIIRPQFKEPRIHFAVNCAAKSCPPLLNKAWTPANLESNFTMQSKNFINNPQHNIITSSGATLSKIFDWYGEDFGDLKAFLNKYSNNKLDSSASIKFSDYNWALNGK